MNKPAIFWYLSHRAIKSNLIQIFVQCFVCYQIISRLLSMWRKKMSFLTSEKKLFLAIALSHYFSIGKTVNLTVNCFFVLCLLFCNQFHSENQLKNKITRVIVKEENFDQQNKQMKTIINRIRLIVIISE